jgi:catechol 2,3-dioxygenase-like lactoylglutathione lyase family enzyme
MIRLQDVTYLVRDHAEALAFVVDALGFVAVFEDPYRAPWDLIQPPAA